MRRLYFPIKGLAWMAAILVTTLALANEAFADEAVDPDLAQGYYLERQRHNPAAAAKFYQKVLDNGRATTEDRAAAKRQLATCQEAAKIVDLARLMPENALVFAELSHPGEHLAQLAAALGVLDPDGESTVVGSGDTPRLEIEDGFGIPVDFRISPALIDELSNVNGAAAAITGFDREGPLGVVVIDAGNSNLIRGLVETGVQLVEPTESIEGFRTYTVENEVWITATHRLIVVARDRDSVANVLRRMNDPSDTGLAGLDAFQKARSQHHDPLAFAFVAGSTLRQVVREQVRGQEALVANALLDLENLDSITAALNTANDEITFDARAELTPGHRNLAYGMVRTAPITGESQAFIPESAAAYALLGLNESGLLPSSGKQPGVMSLLDIGRELFANMQEVGLFVVPTIAGGAREPIPNVGIVISAADADRSERLWKQMLSMPSELGLPETRPPEQVTLNGHSAIQFQFPDEVPPLVLCRVSDQHLVAGTKDAVEEALGMVGQGHIGQGHSPSDSRSSAPNSPVHKLLEVDVDRVLKFVAMLEQDDAREINQIRNLVPDLTVTLESHENENSLHVHGAVHGLPSLQDVLSRWAKIGKTVRWLLI